jgi:hypothetical protein
MKDLTNANNKFKHYTCTDNYYRHFTGMLYTDGVQALCEEFECYWFLDVVGSYQYKLTKEEFQVWFLQKEEHGSAVVTCSDGNDRILVTQQIPFTDFQAKQAIIWVEFNVALLPSER